MAHVASPIVRDVEPSDVQVVANGDRYWINVGMVADITPDPTLSERAQLDAIRAIGQRLVEDADMHLAMLPGEGEGWSDADLHPGVGHSVSAYPEIIDVRGYDPVRHNLFGLDVLHQSERWVDRQGNEHRLQEMTPSHRRNLLAFLRRRAQRLELKDALAALASPLAPGGDMAQLAFEAELDQRSDDPDAWLESTALVTRLRELVAQDESS